MVGGVVYNPIALPFEQGVGIESYLAKASGLKNDADRSGIYVIKPDGRAESRKSKSLEISRGDIIVVPEAAEEK